MSTLCFIDQVPTEILREIFLSHHHGKLGRPAKFLYVSRRWQIVAPETPTLWNIIHLHICPAGHKCTRRPPTFVARHKWESSVAVRCFSLYELAQAIERLGNVNLTLLGDLCKAVEPFNGVEYIPTIRSLISIRCISLVVSVEIIKIDPYGLLKNMQALQSLDLIGTSFAWGSAVQSPFFANIDANSLQLKTLRLHHMVPPGIIRHSTVLARTHHLTLHISDGWKEEDMKQLCTQLQEIRTLSLGGPARSYSEPVVNIPSEQLLHLSLSLISPFIFASSVYRHLIALFVEGVGSSSSDTLNAEMMLELPCLRYLIYKGVWSYLSRLQAPNLLLLAMRSHPADLMGNIHFRRLNGFDSQTLFVRPKYVSLEVNPLTSPLVDIFLTMSPDIVDLELILDERSLSSPAITRRLSETSEGGLVCPRLEDLRFALQSDLMNQENSVARLLAISRSILQSRQSSKRVVSLKSLKYKVVEEGPGFDLHYGLGKFDELWERNLKDGSQPTWENERKRLLDRQGWDTIELGGMHP
ncbi:hypothetical protein CPB86DRAFT_822455 [Serendipita vermifera]|nr:hypothetical protein CPB86DRAFT_822455 [Serendipita vermifera]